MAFENLIDARVFSARKNSGKPAREPLWTFVEMAEEFGVSQNQLRSKMKDPNTPKPQFVKRSHSAPTRSYYKQSEMRKWWQTQTASRSAETKN